MCEGRPVVNSVKARLGQTARSTMAVRPEVGGEVGPLGGAVGQRRLAAHLPWWVEAVGVVLDPLEPAIVAGVSPAHGRGEGSQSLRGLPRGHLIEGDGGAQVVPEPVTGRDDGGSALLAVDGVEALLLALADVLGAGPPLDFVEQFADLVLGRAPGTVSERAPRFGHAAGVLVAELDLQPPGRGVQPAGLRPRGARLRVGSARRRLGQRETESPGPGRRSARRCAGHPTADPVRGPPLPPSRAVQRSAGSGRPARPPDRPARGTPPRQRPHPPGHGACPAHPGGRPAAPPGWPARPWAAPTPASVTARGGDDHRAPVGPRPRQPARDRPSLTRPAQVRPRTVGPSPGRGPAGGAAEPGTRPVRSRLPPDRSQFDYPATPRLARGDHQPAVAQRVHRHPQV